LRTEISRAPVGQSLQGCSRSMALCYSAADQQESINDKKRSSRTAGPGIVSPITVRYWPGSV